MVSYKFAVIKNPELDYSKWNPDCNTRSGYNIVDIQLVDSNTISSDPLLFLAEKSEKAKGQGMLKYCSLGDKLDISELLLIRQCIRDILLALGYKGENFIFFITGLGFVENPDETKEELGYPEEYYCIEACCDSMNINGRISIFEVPRDELDYYSKIFGNFDRVHGIAIAPGKMREVLSILSLLEPVPTTKCGYLVNSESLKSLNGVLEIGSFFFEEISNGTVLRLISKLLSKKNIVSVVEECLSRVGGIQNVL
jgi:hypothetical protein